MHDAVIERICTASVYSFALCSRPLYRLLWYHVDRRHSSTCLVVTRSIPICSLDILITSRLPVNVARTRVACECGHCHTAAQLVVQFTSPSCASDLSKSAKFTHTRISNLDITICSSHRACTTTITSPTRIAARRRRRAVAAPVPVPFTPVVQLLSVTRKQLETCTRDAEDHR